FSHIDRSVFTDNNELNVKSLIKNLKNVIMKKLSVLYMTESFIFLSISSAAVSLSVSLSQSSTLVSVSNSPALTISVLMTLTLTTSALSASIISTFIISSSHFKKMLYRLNELYFSVCTLLFFLSISKTIYYIKI
ncbi:hypothetical protein BDFG_08305, partial [Blastomyces dermatitidis ATCC 26199]